MTTTADLVALRAAATGRVYGVGEVPDIPTHPYSVVAYAPNAPTVRTLNGSGNPARRFTVQHFGKTAASVEAQAAITFTTFDTALVDGDVCWQEIATPVYRDPDDNGVLSVVHTYRF